MLPTTTVTKRTVAGVAFLNFLLPCRRDEDLSADTILGSCRHAP